MKIRVFILFTLMLTSFLACKEVLESHSTSIQDERSVKFMPGLSENLFFGLDNLGNERSCEDMDDLFCSEDFTESDQYALDCQRGGNIAIQCGCHDWICVDKNSVEKDIEPYKITGHDINGNLDSCTPFDNIIDGQEVACTMQFTEEDQFAQDCKDQGHEVVQCDCHKFLCLI